MYFACCWSHFEFGFVKKGYSMCWVNSLQRVLSITMKFMPITEAKANISGVCFN
jgi:hypothetical protein